MKRSFLLSFILILVVALFSGCEKVENPNEVKVINEEIDLSSQSFNDECSIIDSDLISICEVNNSSYIIPRTQTRNYSNIDFSEYEQVNPYFTHYLYILENWIENGFVEFSSPQYYFPYLKKLQVLIQMLESENVNGASKKLVNDFYKHTNKWVKDGNQKEAIYVFLEITLWMIEHPDEDLYEPPSACAVHTWTEIDTRVVDNLLYTNTCYVTEWELFGIRLRIRRLCQGWEYVGIYVPPED